MTQPETPAERARRAVEHADSLAHIARPIPEGDEREDAALTPQERACRAEEHARGLARADARKGPAPRSDARHSRTDDGSPIAFERIER
jgi:hypothetical protein